MSALRGSLEGERGAAEGVKGEEAAEERGGSYLLLRSVPYVCVLRGSLEEESEAAGGVEGEEAAEESGCTEEYSDYFS